MKETPAQLLSRLLSTRSPLQIKLLGDSITHGVGGSGFCQNGEPIVTRFRRNPDGYCWAKLFKRAMEAHYSCTVINNACTGTGIQYPIKYFDTLVAQEDDLVLCTIGTNNRHQMFTDGPKRSREEQGEMLYRWIEELYALFQAKNKPVIFLANIPASQKNERDGKDYWRILHMDDVDAIYQRASEKLGFPLIRLYPLFWEVCEGKEEKLNALLADGLHPNDQGYDVMFRLITRELGLSF